MGGDKDNILASVIIPVLNGEKTLSRCLDSLMNQTYPKERTEILVIDNNSVDNTKSIILQYPVKYLFQKERNASLATNRGIKESKGEILLFIDADCIADKDWMANIVKVFSEYGVKGCQGKFLPYGNSSLLEKYYFSHWHHLSQNISKKESIFPWIINANAAYRREVFEQVGLFDINFLREYDIDFSWRALFAGLRLEYASEAVVHHDYSSSFIKFIKRSFSIGNITPRFVKKYGSLYKLLFIIPYKNPIGFFLYILSLCRDLIRNIFVKRNKIENYFLVLDIIHWFIFFLGNIYGAVLLIFQRETTHNLTPLLLFKNKSRAISFRVRDEYILISPDKKAYYKLNDIGCYMWEALREGKDTGQIIDDLSKAYEISEQTAREDLMDLKLQLEETGLLL